MFADLTPTAAPITVLVVVHPTGEPRAFASDLGSAYRVLTATSAEQAIELLRSSEDLAVVLAAQDPTGVDGARVLYEARVLRPDCRRVLVSASSAFGSSGFEQALDAINGSRPHHVAADWPDPAAMRALLDRLCGWFRHKCELRDALSHRDGLTGLYSHRAFQERLREEMARARRYGKPLSLLYCDIDDFARLNDELGYEVGDAVLRRMAEVLCSPELPTRLRESDVAARFGGEEVAILLPETSKQGAAIKAERVRVAVEKTAFPGDRGIRISIGIAGFPDDAGAPADLIRCAEQALAAAKSAGRNCVRASKALPVRGLVQRGETAPERFTTYHGRLFDIVARLRRDRSLACLFVDLSQLREVERERGPAPRADLFAHAGELLDRMRGDRLRRDDLICLTEDHDGYLCLLAPPREASGSSGIDLEGIAARVESGLERELAAASAALTREPPHVVVGFSRVLDNPLVRPERLLVRLISEAQRSALLHRERSSQRHKALLQEIILRRQLSAVYQPIVDLTSGSIFGFEGLARGPRDSTLESPAALFAVADQVDLTFELDRACFRTALAGASGLEPVHRLFLNLLPTSFYDASFIEREVSNLLEAAALTPANLVFEITERLAIENFSSFRQALAGYTRAGFGVAIDDVGTRHSNLETVMALRPHFLKLSDVLTRGVYKSTVKREMVRSLQRIAGTIDAVIVAEGIERQEDLVVLGELGVRYGQGYFLARPGAPFPQLRTSVRRVVRAAVRVARIIDPPMPAPRTLDEPDDEGEVTDEVERFRLLSPSHRMASVAEPEDAAPSRPPRAHRNGNGSAKAGNGHGSNGAGVGSKGNGEGNGHAETAVPPDGDRPALVSLGEELGAQGGTPLLGALRHRDPGLGDGFVDEETSRGI
jgi:diguanylate cyclase (GGDEF)-like protein